MTKAEENARVRAAYLEIISNSMRKANVQSVWFDPDTYEREGDRVQFTFDNERVVLTSVGIPILDTMELPIEVEVKKDKREMGIVADVVWLQIKTLRRIAYELYDWVRGEDWEDWDIVEKEMVGNFLDSAY